MLKTHLWMVGIVLAIVLHVSPSEAARLKDIADIEGVRGNDLIGYGIVVGLNGTGDKKGTTFTNQAISNLLNRLGIQVPAVSLSLANSAAVLVTSELPPFARTGTKIDVTLSSFGSASTLQGGTLLMTPLKGADGKVYAVAQGPVSVGGFSVASGADTATKNHPTVGRIAKGASIERAIPFDLFSSGEVRIVLRRPDFITITRVQRVINDYFGKTVARAVDSASVVIPFDEELGQAPIHTIADLEELNVDPDAAARIVVNERTGTIIMGENVKVSTVAIAHGNLNVAIRSETQVSQPAALAGQGATTQVVNNNDVTVSEEHGQLRMIKQSINLGDVVDALNGLGATPRDLIAIFQAMQEAGALHAELVVM